MGSGTEDNIIPGSECIGAEVVEWKRVEFRGWPSVGTKSLGGPASVPRADGITDGWGDKGVLVPASCLQTSCWVSYQFEYICNCGSIPHWEQDK